MLYENQRDFANLSIEDARQYFIDTATDLGLDVDRFTEELDNGTYTAKVDQNLQEAVNLSMPGTPSILVDGFVVAGQQLPTQVEVWENYVDETIMMSELADRQYDAPPPMTIDESAIYVATVQMEDGGEFVMELYPEAAPLTVNSFVFLAEEGWFDGVTFHRVLPGFVAQTGDPTGTGRGGPGYMLPNELFPDFTHADVGMVAMANSGPDTNGSQWYVTLGDAAFLDGGYTIFGRVVEGMDEVVQEITPRDPATGATEPGDVIETITIEVKE